MGSMDVEVFVGVAIPGPPKPACDDLPAPPVPAAIALLIFEDGVLKGGTCYDLPFTDPVEGAGICRLVELKLLALLLFWDKSSLVLLEL